MNQKTVKWNNKRQNKKEFEIRKGCCTWEGFREDEAMDSGSIWMNNYVTLVQKWNSIYHYILYL